MLATTVAVDTQAITWVCFELFYHAPKMQQRERCLMGVYLYTDKQRADLDLFPRPLQKLLAQIDRLVNKPPQVEPFIHVPIPSNGPSKQS